MRPVLAQGGPAACLELVAPLLADRDLTCGNLEFCVVEGEADGVAKNVKRVPSSLMRGIETSGVGIWSLSNNHIMDAGPEGLTSTCGFLDEAGVRHFGAGSDLAAAERTVVMQVRGRKIAFVGACDVPRHFASDARHGVAPLIKNRLFRRISDARDNADLVVCTLHADLEFSPCPAPARVHLSRALIDRGADIVVQHHPHVCQGIERHGGGLIAYSLGNFVFPVVGDLYQERTPGTKWSVVLCIDVEWRGGERVLNWRVEPVTLGADGRPSPSSAPQRSAQLIELDKLSSELADFALLRRRWWTRCFQEARSTYYVLRARCQAGVLPALADAVDLLRDPYERRWMYGLLTGGAVG
jgi:poly-gamma-glutamate synthesis protein (capsule biosynthesis protein)